MCTWCGTGLVGCTAGLAGLEVAVVVVVVVAWGGVADVGCAIDEEDAEGRMT